MLVEILQKHIILILFKILLFSLLVIQLVQLTKQYLVPFLRKHIRSLDEMWKSLKNKLQLTKQTEKKLQNKINNQEVELSNLETKIKKWHQSLVEDRSKSKKNYIQQLERVKEKNQKQYEKTINIKLEKEALPLIINNARNILLEKYSGNKGKEVLSKIIKKTKNT